MYTYKVKEILKIYDGDTITVVLDLGFGITKIEKLRLALIDAPELRGSTHDRGIQSRDWLRSRLKDQDITVKTLKDHKGKYGRYIAEIYIDDININKQLVQEGYAEYKSY